MSQQAAVTLNSKVYNPSGSQNGVQFWFERSGGVANSFSPLTQKYASGVGDKKRTKVTFRVEIPTVATGDSTCACEGSLLRTSSFQGEFWMDANATLAERTDLLARAVALVGSTLVSDAIVSLNPAYA